jgi:sugar phosphate isomerase/epimerase
MRLKSIEHIKSVIDLAVAWDVPEVVISPGTRRPMISPSLERTYGWMYESLGTLLPLAKQAGIRLLMENTPYCFTPTIQDLSGIVSTVNDDVLKIVYDVANAAYIGEDPVTALLANHESIALMHISDTGLETWGHDPIGTGVIDFVALGDAVEATCGVSNVVLEIIREENPLYEVDKAMLDLTDRGWKLGKSPRESLSQEYVR